MLIAALQLPNKRLSWENMEVTESDSHVSLGASG